MNKTDLIGSIFGITIFGGIIAAAIFSSKKEDAKRAEKEAKEAEEKAKKEKEYEQVREELASYMNAHDIRNHIFKASIENSALSSKERQDVHKILIGWYDNALGTTSLKSGFNYIQRIEDILRYSDDKDALLALINIEIQRRIDDKESAARSAELRAKAESERAERDLKDRMDAREHKTKRETMELLADTVKALKTDNIINLENVVKAIGDTK